MPISLKIRADNTDTAVICNSQSSCGSTKILIHLGGVFRAATFAMESATISFGVMHVGHTSRSDDRAICEVLIRTIRG